MSKYRVTAGENKGPLRDTWLQAANDAVACGVAAWIWYPSVLRFVPAVTGAVAVETVNG